MRSKIVWFFVFGLVFSKTRALDLRGVVNGDRMGSVPLGISLGSGELDVEGICTKPGMACQNCTQAVTCVRLPVGWLKLPLQQCMDGSTCNAHLGQCSNKPVPECDAQTQQYQHSCEQVGIFPDAHDCRKFHLCSPPEGLPDGRPADHRTALCPRHYGYNPQTAQCSVILQNGQCYNRVAPDCTKLGEFGVLPSSFNHYFVCMMKHGVLHPQIFICPHGWQFWDDGYCKPEPRPYASDNESTESNAVDNSKSSNKDSSSEETSQVSVKTEPTELTTTRIEGFFSTEKSSTYAVDTFLADKFDLSNYEAIDDTHNNNNDYFNSFENNGY